MRKLYFLVERYEVYPMFELIPTSQGAAHAREVNRDFYDLYLEIKNLHEKLQRKLSDLEFPKDPKGVENG